MIINSNKTEEDRAADKAALLIPGGIITFFLGFFMLKELGVKHLELFFVCCYLFFFCGIILILAYYRKTGMAPIICMSAAVLLMVIYRDKVLTLCMAVPLACIIVFYLLSRLLPRIGFLIFMLGNIVFWIIKNTDDKFLIVLLVVGSIYALGRLVGKDSDIYVFTAICLLLVVFFPIRKTPIKWTFVTRFIDKITSVVEVDKEKFLERENKAGGIIYTGYSGSGSLEGALSTKYREEITFKRENGRGPMYLEGSHFATIIPKGQMHKERQAIYTYDWTFYFINSLINAGITPEEASSFIKVETAEVEYTYLKTEDIICPPYVIDIDVILRVESEGKKTRGFKYKVKYLNVDRTDPLYEKMIRSADGVKKTKIHSQEELLEYAWKLYGSDVLETDPNDVDAQGIDSDKTVNDPTEKDTSGNDSTENDTSEKDTTEIGTTEAGTDYGSDMDIWADYGSDLSGISSQFRYWMLAERTEYWDEYIEAVNSSGPLPDKQRYDISYLLSGEYDIETYLDTLMATERMEELVKSITEGLENDYDKALAIEEYLRNSLKYNKKVDLRGYDNFVDAFLFEVKKGYCVHFASAMAVMLRIAGVPSRYVSGYHFNYRTNSVMSSDAHAWVEAYIRGVGWVPFEPTGVSIEMNQSTYEPDEMNPGGALIAETTEEELSGKKKSSEFVRVLRLILLYLGVILAATILFILITIAIKKIIFHHLPPARKLQEIVHRKLKNIEKRIDNEEELKALRANSSSLYNYLKYTSGKYEEEDLKNLLDTYYQVRFRGDDITEDDVRCFLPKNN